MLLLHPSTDKIFKNSLVKPSTLLSKCSEIIKFSDESSWFIKLFLFSANVKLCWVLKLKFFTWKLNYGKRKAFDLIG